jgi:hypothetical protein
MFSLYTLAFAFWSVMVDPRLVSSDNTSQNGVTFVTISVQPALADCHAATLLFSCELFWNTYWTNFSKPKSVFDDYMSKTVTDALGNLAEVSESGYINSKLSGKCFNHIMNHVKAKSSLSQMDTLRIQILRRHIESYCCNYRAIQPSSPNSGRCHCQTFKNSPRADS